MCYLSPSIFFPSSIFASCSTSFQFGSPCFCGMVFSSFRSVCEATNIVFSEAFSRNSIIASRSFFGREDRIINSSNPKRDLKDMSFVVFDGVSGDTMCTCYWKNYEFTMHRDDAYIFFFLHLDVLLD